MSAPENELVSLLATGTPSMTNSGWLSLLSELAPRIIMLTDEPTPPPICEICTPATLPDSVFRTLFCGVWGEGGAFYVTDRIP